MNEEDIFICLEIIYSSNSIILWISLTQLQHAWFGGLAKWQVMANILKDSCKFVNLEIWFQCKLVAVRFRLCF